MSQNWASHEGEKQLASLQWLGDVVGVRESAGGFDGLLCERLHG